MTNAAKRFLYLLLCYKMTTPDKPRSSKQSYRLTEKGRAAIISLERLTHSK